MGRAKLSRAELLEVLERNVQLYREEEAFVPYLVELAVYLLEYEYDWSQSGGHPANRDMKPVDPPSFSRIQRQGDSFGMALSLQTNRRNRRRRCPHCGVEVGDEIVCPSCRNMTR
ncbi:MAG TPA: hypothetical protein PLS90_12175 [Candidatus Sumerlaeota bacterium]|nr:MAG: hypothetical protein BWZ08_02051 [candidate division BRC1 bacterium ADurb.BinA292]HOE96572.1 hypothetical protein [Candidatus Sumerlaeota bacterium]HOR28782.1 hypothetical protein [Candidatus Sumerlaeota bacterium]HPK03203.1 hypothetical protein [Candidatus Sumerlaeota bacterium]